MSTPGSRRAPQIREMRLVLFSDAYEQAVSFFRDGLGLPVSDACGGPGRLSTVFDAGPGRIEVVAEERRIGSGVALRLEVDDVGLCGEGLARCGLRPLGPVELPSGERLCGVGGPGDLLVDLVESGGGREPAPAGTGSPPDLAVLACVDAAADALCALGLSPGQAHVMTNAGGVVTGDIVRDLVAARRVLGVRRVKVVQHRACAFTEPGPFPAAWPPGPEERLRASLSRLLLPPLSLDPREVEGLLCDPGGGRAHRVTLGR